MYGKGDRPHPYSLRLSGIVPIFPTLSQGLFVLSGKFVCLDIGSTRQYVGSLYTKVFVVVSTLPLNYKVISFTPSVKRYDRSFL